MLRIFIGSSKEADQAGWVQKLALWVEKAGHKPISWTEPGLFPPGSSIYSVGVPGRVRNEMLKALIGDRVRDAGKHRLHRLAIAVAEYAVHVRPQPEPLRAMAESSVETVRAGESGPERAPSPCRRSPRASVPNSHERYKAFTTIHENIPE